MRQALTNLWAKTSQGFEERWHPLLLHMLDVSVSAEAILLREPVSTRTRMGTILGLEWVANR